MNNDFWWSGPDWLKNAAEDYPNRNENLSTSDAVKKEVKYKHNQTCLITSTASEKSTVKQMTAKLIVPTKYSKLKKLYFITACIHRYLHNLRNKPEHRIRGPIDSKDLHEAEITWLQFIQQHSFSSELERFRSGKSIKITSKLLKLSPYYDQSDGLIKMGGRLQFADLSEEEKHPIILPSKSYVVKLIVEDIHCRQLHAGINQTLISIRDKYWITSGRQLVKRIVKACIICRKITPVRLQVQTAPLPRERITQCLPFEVVGVDFTGPLYVYQGNDCHKMYVCLYTCGVVRAVHLELVWNLTTDSFVRSFRRFISARGMCKIIWSDNAKTFEKAEKDLKFYLKLMEGKEFKKYLDEHSIQWKYINEYSAWWGGFYERLMHSIKSPLMKILGKTILEVDEMSTLLKEVEAQINSRPLTAISDEPSEQQYITPASFLIGRPTINIPLKPRPTKPCTSDQRELNQFLKLQNKYLDMIWRTWREEYLRSLGTVNHTVNHTDCVKVGELVMVGVQQKLPRCSWDMGVIERLTEGRDGRVRTAHIRTANGVITRSVQHLSRLEADSLEDYNQYPY